MGEVRVFHLFLNLHFFQSRACLEFSDRQGGSRDKEEREDRKNKVTVFGRLRDIPRSLAGLVPSE